LNEVSEGLKDFIFEDEDGRTIKGKITGYSLKSEYNSRNNFLHFNTDDYTQWLLWSKNKPVKIKIRYSIPYLSLFNRHIQFSYGFYDDYIFKFGKPKFKLKLEFCNLEFDDWVYAREYKKPDSILCKEMFIEINLELIDYEKRIALLNELEKFIDDVILVISFIINHRFTSYAYYAQFQDENGKNTETIAYKNNNKILGNEFLKDIRNRKFLNLFKEENLSQLINTFFLRSKDDYGQIKRIFYSYITVNEIKIFEPQFLSAYFLLEAISKLIVKPQNNTNSEELIRYAAEIMNVNLNKYEFKISRNRLIKSTSENEWEITEYRNNLTHFNNLEFNHHEIYEEYKKIMKLCRKLILSYIEPSLSDWGTPE